MAGLEGIKWKQSPPERINKAIEEMKRRGVFDDRCPRCRTSNWNVDIMDLPANSAMAKQAVPPIQTGVGQYYYSTLQPSALLSMLSIVCKNCGYTIFHNMNVLGV